MATQDSKLKEALGALLLNNASGLEDVIKGQILKGNGFNIKYGNTKNGVGITITISDAKEFGKRDYRVY